MTFYAKQYCNNFPSKQPITVHVPGNFNYDKVKYQSQILYLLDTIYTIALYNRKYELGSPVGVSSTILQSILSSRIALKVIDEAIEYKLIQRWNEYIVGEKCKQYLILEPYTSAKKVERKITGKVAQNIFANRLKKKDEMNSLSPIYQHLESFLDGLEIDMNEALNNIQLLLEEKAIVRGEEFTHKRYNDHKCMIEKFADYDGRELIRSYNGVDGRLHTILTNFPSIHRKHITLNGKQLCGLDVANCQPLLLNILMMRFYDRYNEKYPKDFLLYKELTEKGEFYEYCKKRLQAQDRDKAIFKKQMFGRVFYSEIYPDNEYRTLNPGDNEIKYEYFPYYIAQKPQYEEWAIMKNDFPSVATFLEMKKPKYSKGSNQRLATEMQRMESSIILHEICPAIFKKDKKIPLLTIHDNICTTFENVELVKAQMKKAFKRYNLNPKIKEQPFCSEEGS